MLTDFADELGVPAWAAALIIVLVIVQLCLQIASLIHLARQPEGTVRPSKWLWALIIVAGNSLGAVVYWVVAARPPAPIADPLAQEAGHPKEARDRVQRAVTTLYGTERDGR